MLPRSEAGAITFEGYGPIGERRERDLGGCQIDARATFPGGGVGSGIDGLHRYLSERREGKFVDNLWIFLSNMWSGSRHDTTKLPILLVGGLGGALETGCVLDYTGRGIGERKLCSLYLLLMHRLGVKLDHFGDADSRLAGL